jgi:putative solute:sodium symporter small subunit
MAKDQVRDDAHWQKTTKLMFIHLGCGFLRHHPHFKPLNPSRSVSGLPAGFYMAAQGSLIVFVVMLFMFARQQDKIDRDFGVAEDD